MLLRRQEKRMNVTFAFCQLWRTHLLQDKIIIYLYLSLSIIIYHYLSLSIIIYYYLPLSSSVRSPCSSYQNLLLSILIIRVLRWALCWRSPPSSWLVEPCPQTIKSFSSAKTGHCWSSWYGRCLLKGGSNRFLKIKIQYLLCGGEHSL